jgi:pimeloyl-ACP methyl ester carboxylesterase
MNESRSEFLQVRGLRYHMRHWGRDGAPIIVMLHGWMDVSASFQFVVESLKSDWHVIAPDWRGFGLTQSAGTDTYWFPDYLADLDAILDQYLPTTGVNLVGHSMGGNIACLYAGVRPQRIAGVVNLEGFGLPETHAGQAPGRYANWLDSLKTPAFLQTYPSREQVAERLQKNNPRLTAERAEFLSRHWAAQREDGRWHILGDPVHKKVAPVLYRVDEAIACWKRITAPVLWVEAADTEIWKRLGIRAEARAEVDRRIDHISQVKVKTVANAGHMLQHDQPETVARIIEEHLAGTR